MVREGSDIVHHADGQIEVTTRTQAAVERVYQMTEEHRKIDYAQGRENQAREQSFLDEKHAQNEESRAKKRERRGIRYSGRTFFTFSGGRPV